MSEEEFNAKSPTKRSPANPYALVARSFLEVLRHEVRLATVAFCPAKEIAVTEREATILAVGLTAFQVLDNLLFPLCSLPFLLLNLFPRSEAMTGLPVPKPERKQKAAKAAKDEREAQL